MKENKLKKYFSVLGVLAVLISLIGLFGCQKAAKNTVVNRVVGIKLLRLFK